MRRLLLAAAVVLACSGNTGPSTPPANTPATTPPAADSEGANFAAPPPADEQPRGSPPTEEVPPELAERIKQKFGENCRFERACGDLIGIDCDSAVDGPYHYVRRDSLEVVSRCGGACMRGCTDCPPKAWTCPTY